MPASIASLTVRFASIRLMNGDQLTDGLPIFLDSVRRSAVTPQDKEPFAEQKIVWFANDRDVIRGSRMLAANRRAHSQCSSPGSLTQDLNWGRAPYSSLERETRLQLATPSLAIIQTRCRLLASLAKLPAA